MDDVEVVADGEVEAAVVEDRENMVITSSCTDYDEEHGLDFFFRNLVRVDAVDFVKKSSKSSELS